MERIVIIGGGGTGAALAHDLTLRGFQVTLLEKGGLLSGTSGRHHGLLHSGARYVLHDIATARECFSENQILRHLAPQAIETNDGIFVALNEQDMAHLEPFVEGCATAGIPTRILTADQTKALAPEVPDSIKGAVQVPDATMDAWRLPLHFFASAYANGATLRPFSLVDALVLTGKMVTGVKIRDLRLETQHTIAADLVVNAAGPWAGQITAMAGIDSPVQPGPGVMVAFQGRLTHMVINRLHPAGEGDILVPQRNLTIIGSTAWLARDPDQVVLPRDHVQRLRDLGARMMPSLGQSKIHAAWCASRPLLQSNGSDAPMRISRGFACIDHQQQHGLEGFISLVGGKATTLRAMAQEAADVICQKTGHAIACVTQNTPLRPYRHLLQSSTDWI